MAKPAKSVEVEITERTANQLVKGILERFDNIESARGKFMNAARREREGMTAIYEQMAARGISQKVAKTEIKIVRLLERIKSLMAELAADERKMVQRIAKVRGDKQQLSLFADLPKPPKPKKAEKATADNVVPIGAKNGQGAEGHTAA